MYDMKCVCHSTSLHIHLCVYTHSLFFLHKWNFMLWVSDDVIVHLIYLGNLFMSEHIYLSH